MPQTCNGHGQKQVAIGFPGAFAIATKGDVQVVTQPAGQRQMPAAPEILDAASQIRLVKVFREVKAQHQAQADGHGTVAGKVEEQLQRIRQATYPGVDKGRIVHVKRHVHQRRQGVGHQHFHAHADHKTACAEGEVLPVEVTLDQLATHPVITNDRTGNRVAEHRDVSGVIDEATLHRHGVPVYIHQIGNRL